jgi:transglutaminase-like putative cysteine protease
LAPLPRSDANLAAYLKPNQLIPTKDGVIDALARELELDGKPPIVVARTAYDWLIREFTYNYKAPGAGQGDVRWACDSRTGDCNDYHSMFIALCRNQGIPADHEFGYPIRSTNPQGRIPSYHCWARFYVAGAGWIPVDVSEADKHPELREYNFGSQSARLLKFTHGRDVVLVPPQAGPPLNKFIHPYVEIDGKPHSAVKYTVHFRRLTPAP